MSDQAVPHHFQYASARQQADTAVAGMWLFLATEVLFFGALILAWIFCRHWEMAGFDAGGARTNLTIGTINTVVLVSSSAVFAAGLAGIEAGDGRLLRRCLALTAALGVLFLLLKGYEWYDDFAQHLFPGAGFAIQGDASGGAQLFFSFYFVATVLHSVHMLIGIGLVCWLLLRARVGAFRPGYTVPVEVVGLYWSFVDVVWMTLYPLIYLVGRGS
jgi:cytochrome c oxidase subunit 3